MVSQFRRMTLYSILLVCASKQVLSCCVNITVAVIMERALMDMPFAINRTIGVINIAMAKSQEMVKNSVNLNYIVRYADIPTCTYLQFGALAAEIYHNNEIHAIIGPGCSNAVTSIARLTAAWNLPHITYAGTFEALGNKAEYRTLTRMAYNLNVFAKFYMEVFKAFSWTDIANIYDSSSFLGALSARSLQNSFVAAGVRSYELSFNSMADDVDNVILTMLKKAKTMARVFLVSCHGDFLRKIALTAPHIGMARGEYTIIYYLSDPISAYIGDYKWLRGDNHDSEARLAYESVMVICPRRPNSAEFFELEIKVKRQALSLYNFRWKPGSQIGIFNIAQYDSFILYAYAIKETVAAGEDPRDTSTVLRRMWNRTFTGNYSPSHNQCVVGAGGLGIRLSTGFRIGGMTFINENGDRETDFTLLDLAPETGQFEVVAQYLGYTGTFELLPDVPIHWPNSDSPHPNKPPCGFVGELCKTFTFPLIGSVALGFSAVIFVIVVAGILYLRHIHAEAAIQSDWWRVKWEDVKTQNKSTSISAGMKHSVDESLSLAPALAAVQTKAIYKGETVYVQKLKINFLTIDRSLMLELKQMRDVNCPNLTRLIGLCPERNNICIITEYCSRGTLQDILQNKSIQLEREFRISLVNDIVQGMYYLHTCPIGVHGNLSSITCVIDSRFILKITGFGLPSLSNICKDTLGASDVDSYGVPDLLWKAPEILRSYPCLLASQPGDVYSFAIILYEMCTRNEPFISEPWYRSVEDTMEQLTKKQPIPRRPSFDNRSSFPEIADLATECWRENPEERPTFAEIKKKLQDIRRGNPHGKNVLDMLLHRMEQYANNLEGLVEERTNAFLEEKKRSEELLYQVLPRSVADQLRSGRNVIPEEFKSVTVYFSDIVGFTKISAISTPFQVVDLLNEVYTCFDEIIENFDVYKVETIGDAYMVVSGLPIRNANEHVREIARMSIRILKQLRQFVIGHLPAAALQARIGIHSGPVVAGVVGRKMPRYCLFGDTVNTASRMESHGQPMKIHVSDATKHLLKTFGTFVLEDRGYVDIKGKGTMRTHWLLDEVL